MTVQKEWVPENPWHNLPISLATTGKVTSSALTDCWQNLHTIGINVPLHVSEITNTISQNMRFICTRKTLEKLDVFCKENAHLSYTMPKLEI